eukprot:jgi/Ulvmu1/4096/UM019_0075.1
MSAVNLALEETLHEDGRNVLVFGQDVGFGGVFRCTQNLQTRFGKDRVFSTPTNEMGIVGFAIGAAAMGMRPVAEIQFADYWGSACDQILNELAKYRYRSGGLFNCGGVTIRMPYGAVGHGGHYHSQSPEAFFCHMPGIKVCVPSGPADAYELLKAAHADPDPVIIMEPKQLYRTAVEDVHVGQPGDASAIGRARVARTGSQLTIVAWGQQVGISLQAAEQLESKLGISCEVIDLRTLIPWDRTAVEESVNKTGRLLVTHEAPSTAGFGAEIVAHVSKRCFLRLEVPPERVCGWDTPFPCVYESLYVPSALRLYDAGERMMKF